MKAFVPRGLMLLSVLGIPAFGQDPKDAREALILVRQDARESVFSDLPPEPSAMSERQRADTFVSGLPAVVSGPAPPATVSASKLKHKVPKAARKVASEAQKLSKQGRHLEAVERLKSATSLDPDFAEAYCNLGVQFIRLDRYQEAEEAFLRALSLDPRETVALSNMAFLLLARGDAKGAERYAREAVRYDSGDKKAQYFLGLALLESPETRKEAVRRLEIAAPGIPAARSALAAILGSSKQ